MQTVPEPIKVLRRERKPLPLKKESDTKLENQGGEELSKSSDDNHANQCNPNNDAYWESRGHDERPDDREDRIEEDDE